MTTPEEREVDLGASAPAGSFQRQEPKLKSGSDPASAAIAFLATVSHEIRTPVNAILGYHELLELGLAGPLTDKQRLYIERASASGRHLLSIIDDVLDFARIDAERLHVSREAFRLGAVMSDALLLVAPQARLRRIDITNATGRAAYQLAAWGDPGRVKQILINLLSNAVKFTEARDGAPGRLTIAAGITDDPPPEVKASRERPLIFVRVEDTGPGIAANRLEAIFDPFVQGDQAIAKHYGGSGLGLAISRRLARLMGGDLTARSEEGVGSTFFLWLPAAPADAISPDPLDEGERLAAASDTEPVLRPLFELDRPPRHSNTFVAIGDAIIDQLEDIVKRYHDRLRSDPQTPSARRLTTSRIEDHLATFLADMAATLEHWEVGDRELTDSLLDSSAIQRTIALKHGEQRARLGWAEGEIRREYQILEEEVARIVRDTFDERYPSPSEEQRRELEAAEALLRRFLASAQRRSVASARAFRERTPAPE
jgi:signal transduction histidine kinase